MRKKESPEKIYSAALSVFAEYGFRKATLEDIADRLGMTKGNLYRYSKNKQDLYQSTVSWALLKWQTAVRDELNRHHDPKEQFTAMCFSAVAYLSENDDFRKVLSHDPDIFPMFPERDPFFEINRDSVLLIKNILKNGIQQGQFRPVDVEKVSEVIFMVYKMVIIRTYVLMEEKFVAEMFAEVFELLTNGLFAEREGLQNML